MEDLVLIMGDKAVCTSLQVAEKFGKRHQEVLYAIEGRECSCKGKGCKKCNGRGYQQLGILQEDLEISVKSHLSKMFQKSSYKDNGGRTRPLYYMSRDGFSLLAMGFTGKEALDWKIKYINAFNALENALKERNTQLWIEQRTQGKLIRNEETGVIKQLIQYAKEQGSTHADMLYMTYSKLANKMTGISDRDLATFQQLSELSFIENIILNQIRVGMEKKQHYKDIYKNCKRQIELFKDIAYLECKT